MDTPTLSSENTRPWPGGFILGKKPKIPKSPRFSLRSPWCLDKLIGSVPMMGREEALRIGQPGTKVLLLQEGRVFLAEIRAVDLSGSYVAICLPAWPDEPQQWIPTSSLFSMADSTKSLCSMMEEKLSVCYSTWDKFRYHLGQQVIAKCGKIARFDGIVEQRCIRQYDATDQNRDNPQRPFVPMYVVAPIDVEAHSKFGSKEISSLYFKEHEISAENEMFGASQLGQLLTSKRQKTTELCNGETSQSLDKPSSSQQDSKPSRTQSESSSAEEPVCKACKFGAHSAHTCGRRGKSNIDTSVGNEVFNDKSSSPESQKKRRLSDNKAVFLKEINVKNSSHKCPPKTLQYSSASKLVDRPPPPRQRIRLSLPELFGWTTEHDNALAPSHITSRNDAEEKNMTVMLKEKRDQPRKLPECTSHKHLNHDTQRLSSSISNNGNEHPTEPALSEGTEVVRDLGSFQNDVEFLNDGKSRETLRMKHNCEHCGSSLYLLGEESLCTTCVTLGDCAVSVLATRFHQ